MSKAKGKSIRKLSKAQKIRRTKNEIKRKDQK